MFKYKSEAELQAMTAEQRDIYAEQKRAFEADQRKAEIAEAIKGRFPEKTQAEIDAEATEKQKTTQTIDQIKEDLRILKEQSGPGGPGKVVKMIGEIKANKDALKAIGATGKEVTLKAATNRASIDTNPNQMMLPGIGQLVRVARSLYNVFRKVNLPVGSHNGTIKYIDWDEATTVKAAATIAEGAAFPESTAKFKGYSLDLKKIGDSLPVTEEFFEDEVNAAAELEMFIENNVESAKDSQIVNGDNTGDNLKGLIASVPAYAPAAAGIVDANIFDLITKVKENIVKFTGSKYQVNFAAMNLSTINKLVLKKDENNQYLFPPQHPIYNMIVEDNNVADNVIVVGDSRFAVIYEMGGVTLSRGLVNAQFTSDFVTLKARQRLLFLIRNSDQSGFRKVTDVDAALVTLASS